MARDAWKLSKRPVNVDRWYLPSVGVATLFDSEEAAALQAQTGEHPRFKRETISVPVWEHEGGHVHTASVDKDGEIIHPDDEEHEDGSTGVTALTHKDFAVGPEGETASKLREEITALTKRLVEVEKLIAAGPAVGTGG